MPVSLENPTQHKQILLVEDNTQMRETIATALKYDGYVVHQAQNGLKALDILQKIKPDLILSDINMPQMDGINFYKMVRKKTAWIAIPFIFLTANDAPEEIQRGRELGVEDYLTKPIDTRDLIGIVNARLLRAAEVQIAYIGQAYLETVNVLANTIEGRDPYTHGHVERVARYTRWMAEALQWPPQFMQTLEFGSRLHDIGKIIVPDRVLKKPGPLSPEEWSLMKQHPTAGAKIIRDIHLLRETLPYILYHHEKWDGTGYPRGLQGREIPIEGRLLAIVDVFDALTSARPYRPSRPIVEVAQFIKLKAGSHFDPKLVPIFLDVIKARIKASPFVETSC